MEIINTSTLPAKLIHISQGEVGTKLPVQVKDNMEMRKIVLSYGSYCKVKLKYIMGEASQESGKF